MATDNEKLVVETVLSIISEQGKVYEESKFKRLDQVILEFKNYERSETVAAIIIIRKGLKSLFELTSKLMKMDADKQIESQEYAKLIEVLDQLILTNMQLRAFNNEMNHNSSAINTLCEEQCWLANIAILAAMEFDETEAAQL